MRYTILPLLLISTFLLSACAVSQTPLDGELTGENQITGDTNSTVTIPENYFTCQQDSDCIIVESGSHICTCNSAINKNFENQFHIAAQRSRDEQYASSEELPRCKPCGTFERTAAACVNSRCAFDESN